MGGESCKRKGRGAEKRNWSGELEKEMGEIRKRKKIFIKRE